MADWLCSVLHADLITEGPGTGSWKRVGTALVTAAGDARPASSYGSGTRQTLTLLTRANMCVSLPVGGIPVL
jgi:hypothetical protein